MDTAELADGIEAALEAASTLERREASARYLKTGLRVVGERHPMISKALSWALRVLGTVEPGAVWEFLERHEGGLAAHVKREVRAKLETGRKNPGRGG